MGKTYYCDFCCKSFADNKTNRKNHLKGLTHQRLRKLHYDSFKDAATVLAEETAKRPCKHFSTGHCDFGESCRFSHMTEEERQRLVLQGKSSPLAQELAKPPCKHFTKTGQCKYGDRCRFSHLTEEERVQLRHRDGEQKSFSSKRKAMLFLKPPKLEDWLAQREKRLKIDTVGDLGKSEEDIPDYVLPVALHGFPDLPPSLLPPSKEDLLTAPRVSWGGDVMSGEETYTFQRPPPLPQPSKNDYITTTWVGDAHRLNMGGETDF